MPDAILSPDIDAFLIAANKLLARDALGTKQNLSISVATEAEIKAAFAAVEANPSYDRGTIYVTANITITDVLGTALTKDYTIIGLPSSALGGLRPQITKGNGPWFSSTGKRLIFSNLRLSIVAPQDFITCNQSSYITFYGCDITQGGGGNTLRRDYYGGLAIEFINSKITVSNGSLMWIGAGNPANTDNPQFVITFVGSELIGRVLTVSNAGKGRVSLVDTKVSNNGQGCWYATEYSAGRTDVEIRYSSADNVSTDLGAGSTEPITFVDVALLATQTVSASANITAERNVRFTGNTPGQLLSLPAAADGKERWVYNKSSVPVDVGKIGTDTVNGGAGPYTVPAGATQRFVCFGTDWNT